MTITLEVPQQSTVVVVVDADDFVKQLRSNGEHWANEQLAAAAATAARTMYCHKGSGWRYVPPDEWVLTFGGSHSEVEQRALDCAEDLRRRIRVETGITVSIGVSLPQRGPNALVAAEDLARSSMRFKLVSGGDQVFQQQSEGFRFAGAPPRIERILANRVYAGDRVGAARLIVDWIAECAVQPGISPSQLQEWAIGQLLFVMDLISPRRSSSGSTDWLGSRTGVSLGSLVQVAEIHELSYLQYWITEVLNQLLERSVEPDACQYPLQNAEDYLSKHFSTPGLQLSQVADAVAVSPFHLARLFRRYRDTTFLHHLTGLRMASARHLLATTNRSVENVGLSTGHASTKHFRAVFKREVGCSPSEFRRSQGRFDNSSAKPAVA